MARAAADFKLAPDGGVKSVESPHTSRSTSASPGTQASVELLRARARAAQRPKARKPSKGAYRHARRVVVLAVAFFLAPSPIWVVGAFVSCIALAQAGWLPPFFLRGPWATMPRGQLGKQPERIGEVRDQIEQRLAEVRDEADRLQAALNALGHGAADRPLDAVEQLAELWHEHRVA